MLSDWSKKAPLSLIGDGLCGAPRDVSLVLRVTGLIDPVGVGSGRPLNAEARDSSVAWRLQDLFELLFVLLLIEQLPA